MNKSEQHTSSNSRQMHSNDGMTDEIDLKQLLFDLWHQKWFILIVMSVVFLLTLLFVLRKSPTYVTTALIQVENQETGVEALQGLGMDAMLGKTSSALPSEIETALMQSIYILGPTIQKHHLDIQVNYHYFPIFGVFMARLHTNDKLAPSFLGMSRYAWGGEEINVSKFIVPELCENKRFTLVVCKNNSYALYDFDNTLVLKGRVGYVESSHVLPGLKLVVTKLKAHEGTRFYLMKISLAYVVNGLKAQLSIQDSGLERRETGILTLSLAGTNRDQLARVLNTLIHYEVQKNTEKKSAEIRQTLAFLKAQLPIVKKDLDTAENALSQYRAKTGSLGLSFEAQVLLQELVNLEQEYEQLKLKKATLLLSFTQNHPWVIAVSDKESQLKQQLNTLRAKMSLLPKSEQKAVALERDVKVKNQMYLMLLTKIQQLQVAEAGTISDVRILSQSERAMPAPSKKPLILVAGLVFGFVLAVLIIFIRKLLTHSIADPDYVEEHVGVPAYAIIPHSRVQEKLTKEMKRKIPGSGPFILAQRYPKDLAIEGLRSLRTTLQFALLESKNNIVSITGSSPSIGKSFISTNLAFVLADSGKRVLLIDADMRKGRIFEYVMKSREPGFADMLSANLPIEKAIQPISDKVDFIATGHYPKNPSELLLSNRLEEILTKMSDQYDIVLIDTPPILAVTDAVLITKLSGINLLIIGSEKEDIREIEHTVKRLRKNKVNLNGLIFNNTQQRKKAYGYYNYNYYYYDYNSPKK